MEDRYTVSFTLAELLKDPVQRDNLLEALVCDEEFLDRFVSLIAEGLTPMSSAPCDRVLTSLRARLGEALGNQTVVDQARELEQERKRNNEASWDFAALKAAVRRVVKTTGTKGEDEPYEPQVWHHTRNEGDCALCAVMRLSGDK